MEAISTQEHLESTEMTSGMDFSEVPALESHPAELKKRARNKLKTNMVGQFVMIESGRYVGKLGYVTRGGNGYFAVNLLQSDVEQPHTIKKRSQELRVVDAPADYQSAGFIIQPSRPIKRRKHDEKDEDFTPSHNKRSRGLHTNGVNWIDKQVVLTKGKYRGELGTVTRSGHGFYAVYLPDRGIELMKRASELNLYNVQEITIPVAGSKAIQPEDLESAANILMDMLRERGVVSVHMVDNMFHDEDGSPTEESDSAPELSQGEVSQEEDEDSGLYFQEEPIYPHTAEYCSLRTSASTDLAEEQPKGKAHADHPHFSSPMYYPPAASHRRECTTRRRELVHLPCNILFMSPSWMDCDCYSNHQSLVHTV
eukprot:g29829.t1